MHPKIEDQIEENRIIASAFRDGLYFFGGVCAAAAVGDFIVAPASPNFAIGAAVGSVALFGMGKGYETFVDHLMDKFENSEIED